MLSGDVRVQVMYACKVTCKATQWHRQPGVGSIRLLHAAVCTRSFCCYSHLYSCESMMCMPCAFRPMLTLLRKASS